MNAVTLLPGNRTPFETAVSLTSAARRGLPASLVASVFNPDTCPVDLLGYLANALSVDVWDDKWPEAEKRNVCRDALKLHRLKTTPAGIKAHVALTGAEVKRIIRPPAKSFLRGAMTEENRRAWLDALPQIRIYPYINRETPVARQFFSGGVKRFFHGGYKPPPQRVYSGTANALLPGLSNVGGETRPAGSAGALLPANQPPNAAYVTPYAGQAGALIPGLSDGGVVRFTTTFVRASRGLVLAGRRATIWDQGVEIDVNYESEGDGLVERVFIGRNAPRAWHGSGYVGHTFLTKTHGPDGVATVSLADDFGFFAVGKGVTPVDVRPQRVYATRTAPRQRSFFGRFFKGTHMAKSHAPFLIYDRVSLNDPARTAVSRKAKSFHGHGRFGIAPFTAELLIDVPMKRPEIRSRRWHGQNFMRPADMAPLTKAIQAVRASKAFRDTVLIDTATYGQVEFAGGLRFGDFAFGEIKEVA